MNPNKTKGEYRPIYESLFHAPEYLALSAHARLVLVTLKGLSGATGLKSWPGLVAVLEELCGVPSREVKRSLSELEKSGWIEREGHLVWVVNGLLFEPSISTGTKHQAYVAKQLAPLPACALLDRFRARYAAYLPDTPSHTLSDTPSKGYRKGVDTPCDTTNPSPTTAPSPSPSPATAPSSAIPRIGLADSDEVTPNRGALLAAAANRGITERYGEQPNPIRWTHASTDDVLAAFDAAGVPDDFAVRTIVAKARALKLERPPSTLGYFRVAVIEAWQAELAHRAAATIAVPEADGASGGVIGEDVIHKRMAIKYAKQGDTQWQDECRRLGVEWEAA